MAPTTGITTRYAAIVLLAITANLSIIRTEAQEVARALAEALAEAEAFTDVPRADVQSGARVLAEPPAAYPRNGSSTRRQRVSDDFASERRAAPATWYSEKVWFVQTPDNTNECGVAAGIPAFPVACLPCGDFITLDVSSCITYPAWAGSPGGTDESICNALYPKGMAMMLFAATPKSPGTHYSDKVLSRYVKMSFNLKVPEYVKIERRETDAQRAAATCRPPFGITNGNFYYSLVASQVQDKTVDPDSDDSDSSCLVKYGTAYYSETFGSPAGWYHSYFSTWNTAEMPGNELDAINTDVIIRCLDSDDSDDDDSGR